jgi:chorismate synthase
MAGNRLGAFYSIMTFGESHGPYIGVVIDGIKPGIEIDEDEIQKEMNRRRPGQSNVTTPRNEKDQAMIVSGIFEGKTTGTPICILIKNEDQRSKDYSKLQNIFRPGHAAYTYLKKYGIFDYRGGGRASGRETATRVAAGAIAKQILNKQGIEFKAFTKKVGSIEAKTIDYDFIEKNPVRCCDPQVASQMISFIEGIASEGDSIGGIVELHIKGLPPGLGDPVFEKIDAELAHGLMSIGAIKGIEFGNGFKVSEQKGSETNDLFYVSKEEQIEPQTNHSGGVLAGISTGQDIILRLAVKAPSSIRKTQTTVDNQGNEVQLSIEGRHDPCICPRVVPVAEAVAALVILDLVIVQNAISNNSDKIDNVKDELDVVDAQLMLLLKRHQVLETKLNQKSSSESEQQSFRTGIESELQKFARELNLDYDGLTGFWKNIGKKN